MFGVSRGEIKEIVEATVEQLVADHKEELRERFKGLTTVTELHDEITWLKEEVEDLRIQKTRKEEEHERREREIEHQVGLHKERVEQEMEHARTSARLEAREQHLEDQLDVLEERADMIEKYAGKTEKHLQAVVELLGGKVPDAKIIANIGRGSGDAERTGTED